MESVEKYRQQTRELLLSLGCDDVDPLAGRLADFMERALLSDRPDEAYSAFLAKFRRRAETGKPSSGLAAWLTNQREILETFWSEAYVHPASQTESKDQERKRLLRTWLKQLDLLDRCIEMEVKAVELEKTFRGFRTKSVDFEVSDRNGSYTHKGNEGFMTPDQVRAQAASAKKGLASLGLSEAEARDELGDYEGLGEKL